MAALNLSSVPDELYERIRALADAGERTVEEEAVGLLSRAVGRERPRRSVSEILKWIRENRIVLPPGTPDSVELLREDRDR